MFINEGMRSTIHLLWRLFLLASSNIRSMACGSESISYISWNRSIWMASQYYSRYSSLLFSYITLNSFFYFSCFYGSSFGFSFGFFLCYVRFTFTHRCPLWTDRKMNSRGNSTSRAWSRSSPAWNKPPSSLFPPAGPLTLRLPWNSCICTKTGNSGPSSRCCK